MEPSKKIQLIKAIASRLTKESWAYIDLTLRQFGLPTGDTSFGTHEEYIISVVESAADDTLVDIATHLGFQSLPASTLGEPSCWVENCFRLFLSHTSSKKVQAVVLQKALHEYHISTFVAHVDIEPTKEWQNEIERALRTCDALSALLTTDFHASYWTDQEVGIAAGRGVLILPLRYEIDPYGFIGKYQAITMKKGPAEPAAEEIFTTLARHPLTRSRLADYVISSFEQSWSWEGARQDMALLETFRYFESDQLDRILATIECNDKVKDTFTVPDRAKKLVGTLRQASV